MKTKITREDAFILWMMASEITDAQRLLSRFGSAEAVFRSGFAGAAACRQELEKAVRQTEAAMDTGMRFISYKNPEFPTRLAAIPGAPPGIFVYGSLPDESAPNVAIIGMRDCTHYGGQTAYRLGKELAALGLTIISGMARGLDACAHEGALAAEGKTAAILPGGADVCYPTENFQLYRRIKNQGCIISESMPGLKPRNWSYPARNRIISAMSDVLIVVEAGERSGTLTTVNHALDQGKEVFAVPGRIFDATSAGTNALIKQGAHILTDHLDILAVLRNQNHLANFFAAAASFHEVEAKIKTVKEKISLASDQALVYACISHEAVSTDYIAYKTGLNVPDVNKILLELELAGQIKKISGQKYIKT